MDPSRQWKINLPYAHGLFCIIAVSWENRQPEHLSGAFVCFVSPLSCLSLVQLAILQSPQVSFDSLYMNGLILS